jgi:hypothetical protein
LKSLPDMFAKGQVKRRRRANKWMTMMIYRLLISGQLWK